MLGELVPCGGGDPIPLLKPVLMIGRRSDCDILLSFPNVSSHHCELELLNGFWSVRDLNSRNGIKINDVRFDTKFLMPGDILSIARHRFEIQYEPSGDAPAPKEEDPLAIGLLEKAGLMGRRISEPRSRPVADPNSENRGSDKQPRELSEAEENAIAKKWLQENQDHF